MAEARRVRRDPQPAAATDIDAPDDTGADDEPCPVCHEAGELDGEQCWGCMGAKRVPRTPAPDLRPLAADLPDDDNSCPACGVTVDDPAALVAHTLEQHPDRLRAGATQNPSLAGAVVADSGEPVTSGTAAPANDAPADPPVPDSGIPIRRRARVAEGRPWEPYNSDGSLNIGSYEVGAAVGTVEWAHDLLVRHHRDEATETGVPFVSPPAGQVRALARRILRAADIAQALLRADGNVDRMAASHTRARGAIRSVMYGLPVPWGAPEDEIDDWVRQLGSAAAVLLRVAVTLNEPDPLTEEDLKHG